MGQKTILITGCSSGIGYDAAKALVLRGHRVFATCRKPADVARLTAEGLESLYLDVTEPESIKKALRTIAQQTGGRLDVLINNAGFGQFGALEDLSPDLVRQQFAVNVFGLLDVTTAALELLRQSDDGRIINISSILGLVSIPFQGIYAASKHAVEALSDTLRLELQSANIRVISIVPGPITSRFRENSLQQALQSLQVTKSHYQTQYQRLLATFTQKKAASRLTQPASAVSKKIIQAIEKKHPNIRYPVTLPAYFLIHLKRVMPNREFHWLLKKIFKKELAP